MGVVDSGLSASPPNLVISNTVLKSSMNNRSGLKCCCFNSRSIVNKIDEIKLLLENVNVDIVCITETWLKDHVSNIAVSLPGFRILRNDRNTKSGGGVCIFVRNSIYAKLIYKQSSPNLEVILVEIVCDQVKILLGVCYKPPRLECISELDNIFHEYSSAYNDIIFCGDFNYNMLNPSKPAAEFQKLLDAYDLKIVNCEPTYFYDESASMLDLIITNTNRITFVNQISVGFTDHDILYWTYGNFVTPNANPIYFRDFKNINIKALIKEDYNFPWNSIYVMNDVNEQVELFNSCVSNLYDKYVPLRLLKCSKSTNPPWMTYEVQQLIALRDFALRTWKLVRSNHLRSIYTKIRNKVTSQIREAKRKFLNNKLNSVQTPKSFWQTINQLGLGNDTQFAFGPIFEPSAFVNEFAPTFNNISIKSCLYDEINESEFSSTGFSFKTISLTDLTKALNGIKSNSIGLDGISIKFIKIIFPFVSTYLLTIINKIITTGVFPSVWKYSKVIPIPKINNPTITSEFRPISIVSSLSKLVERVLSEQIVKYTLEYGMLDSYQSAYKSQHSTGTAVLSVVDDIRRNADNNKVSILVLLDFSKAFDRVEHTILLHKLKQKFNFGRTSWLLIQSYLSNRSLKVFVGEKSSECVSVCSGVPQGSVLGPLLFAMYINDLPKVISVCKYHLFADDVQIYSSCSIEVIDDCIDLINTDIQNIAKWASDNNLLVNASKTQAIVIYRRNINTNYCNSIRVNNEQINFSSKVRNLGIIINKTLTWDDHINMMTGKLYYMLRKLWALTKFATPQLRRKLFVSYVFPHFLYGDVVFYGLQDYNFKKLEKAFNAGIRYVFNLHKFDHISHYANKVIGCHIREYYEFRVCSLIYKVLKYEIPIYLALKFQVSKSARTKNLLVPLNKYDILNHSFFVRGICLWNSLPLTTRLCESYRGFRHHFISRNTFN